MSVLQELMKSFKKLIESEPKTKFKKGDTVSSRNKVGNFCVEETPTPEKGAYILQKLWKICPPDKFDDVYEEKERYLDKVEFTLATKEGEAFQKKDIDNFLSKNRSYKEEKKGSFLFLKNGTEKGGKTIKFKKHNDAYLYQGYEDSHNI